ncbi:MAG: hypothetical protein LBN05_07090 [Oscillospiraceae bacterium]|jgi:MraZ protein|nr:hypothetical protein [Oscillospiraceae bacterium]
MTTFWGESLVTLDAQGRFAVPKDARALLGDEFVVFEPVIAAHTDCPEKPHLVVMSAAKFFQYSKRLKKRVDGQRRNDIIRTLAKHTFSAKADSAGRVTLPQSMRSYAGLAGKLTVLGTGTYLELWAVEQLTEAEDLVVKAQEAGLLDMPDVPYDDDEDDEAQSDES